jgi:hypothetical protein
VNLESERRRINRGAYKNMSAAQLRNEAHAALPHARPYGREQASRSSAAKIAAIAHEMTARGLESEAAVIRSYRRTAMTAPVVSWQADRNDRVYPVALPAGYVRDAFRERRAPARSR